MGSMVALLLWDWFWFRPSPWVFKPVSILWALSLLIASERRYRPASGLLLLGAVMNAVAVLLNGGRMPVALEYWETSHKPPTHQLIGPDTQLRWLADVLPGGSSAGDWLGLVSLGWIFGMLTFSMIQTLSATRARS